MLHRHEYWREKWVLSKDKVIINMRVLRIQNSIQNPKTFNPYVCLPAAKRRFDCHIGVLHPPMTGQQGEV